MAIALLFGGGLVAVAGAFATVKLTTWLAEFNVKRAELREFKAVVAEAYAAYWTSLELDASAGGTVQRYALLGQEAPSRTGDASALRELQAVFIPVTETPGLAALQREGLVASVGMRRDWGTSQSAFDLVVVRAVVPSGLPRDATRRGEIIARVVAGLQPPPEGDLLVVSLVEEVGPGTVKCLVASLATLGSEEAAQRAYESWKLAGGVKCA